MATLLYKIIFCIVFLIFISSNSIFAAPKVSILTSPIQVNKNEEFGVSFNITSDLLSSDSYYVKGRIGSSSSSMNQGETYNSITNTWLSDTSSWNSFPFIAFSNSLIATSTVSLRAKSSAFTGNNFLLIRLNRNSTSYDSSPSALLLLDIPIPTLPAEVLTEADSPTPTPISYLNIYISEVMANPVSGEKEWVELFNDNDFSVILTGWFIDDIENGGSSPKLFSANIPAKSYYVIKLSSSMFNNSGDSVRLLDFNKNLIDSFEYSETTKEKSLGRISFTSDEFCIQEPSEGTVNNICINSTPTPQPTPTPIKSPTITPVSINRLINANNNAVTPIIRIIGEGNVLGTSTNNTPTKSPVKYLSFLSFSYSVLTIVSVFLRMKV